MIAVTLMLLLVAALLATPAQAQYVGFGSITRGADDCPSGSPEVYRVTNLNNDGSGSFRDAVSEGCRHVVFDVGGEIEVSGTIKIDDSYITIDGSTAPSPGITFDAPQQRLVLEATNEVAVHDVIISHLRAVGDSTNVEAKDIWELDGSSGAPIYNIIFDHLTMTKASDGAVDMWGEVYNVTLSNSLIYDTRKAQHYSEPTTPRDGLTIYRNVYARNSERQPKIRYDTTRVDFINNVIYGWGWFRAGASGMFIEVGGSQYSPSVNVENNIYHHVSGLAGGENDAIRLKGTLYGDWFFSGNEFPAGETDAVSTSGQVLIPAEYRVSKLPASALGDGVVPCAGTHYPTAEEVSLLQEVSLAVGGTGVSCSPAAPRPKPPTNLQAN